MLADAGLRTASRVEAEAECRARAPGACLLHRTSPDASQSQLLLSIRLRSEVRHCVLASEDALVPSRTQDRMRTLTRLLPRQKTKATLLVGGGGSAGGLRSSPTVEALVEAYQQPQQQLNKLRAFVEQAESLVVELIAEPNYLEVSAEAVPNGVLQTLLLLRPFVLFPRRPLADSRSVSFLLCFPSAASGGGSTAIGSPAAIGYCSLEVDLDNCCFSMLPCWPDSTPCLRRPHLTLAEQLRIVRSAAPLRPTFAPTVSSSPLPSAQSAARTARGSLAEASGSSSLADGGSSRARWMPRSKRAHLQRMHGRDAHTYQYP